MSGAHIYRKTDKGRNEIATRANRLGLRERTMLIMVDDKSTRQQLLAKNSHSASEGILDELLAQGYIETVLDGAPSNGPAQGFAGASEPAVAPAAAVPSHAPATASPTPGVEVSVVSATRFDAGRG